MSDLLEVSRAFAARGWCVGTSGNFSMALNKNPLTLGITASGVDKRTLSTDQILEIDSEGRLIGIHSLKPSAETRLHLTIVQTTGAGSVLHVHSVWNNIISGLYAHKNGIALDGYEMLKGLEGVTTHDHREWIPILENTQDMEVLSQEIKKILNQYPQSHGFLLKNHGLYTWGADVFQAQRHVEIFEFLFETVGRLQIHA